MKAIEKVVNKTNTILFYKVIWWYTAREPGSVWRNIHTHPGSLSGMW